MNARVIDWDYLKAVKKALEKQGSDRITFYKGIPGRFDFHELYRKAVARAADGDRFVEVGSLFGASAAFLSDEAKVAEKHLNIDVVDLWNPEWPERAHPDPVFIDLCAQAGSFFDVFQCFIRNHGADVNIKRGDSLRMLRSYPDQSLQFVFLDGHHAYDRVTAEIAIARQKIKPGGILAGHDFYGLPTKRPHINGVAQAVTEAFDPEQIQLFSSSITRSWWVDL